ncbi:MAG: PadR family transcriptional regulator [Anaerolineales bacterium]
MSVRNAILGLLAKKPRHGYELRAAFSAVVGEAGWDKPLKFIRRSTDLKDGASAVQTKSDIGEGREPDRRIYAITRDGRHALKEWFDDGVPNEHQRDEFLRQIDDQLDLRRSGPRDSHPNPTRKIISELHDATTRRDRYDAQVELAKIFLSDKIIMHLEADLRWLDMIEMRIESIKKQPLDEVEVTGGSRPKKGDKGSTYPPPS